MSTTDDFAPAFEFDGGEYSRDDVDSGGTVNLPGWYHFEIVDVQDELATISEKGQPKSASLSFDCMVLHSAQGQSPKGMRHYHRVYFSGQNGAPAKEGAIKSAIRFGLGIGVLKEVEIDGRKCIVDAETGTTKITPKTFCRGLGRQFVATLEPDSYTDASGNTKSRFQIPFGRVYSVTDPAVANVAKDQAAVGEYLARTGEGHADAKRGAVAAQAAAAGASAPAATAPAQPARQPMTAAALDMSDL